MAALRAALITTQFWLPSSSDSVPGFCTYLSFPHRVSGTASNGMIQRETAAVISALKERNLNTSEHCNRTCALSVETGKAIGLSSADLFTLQVGARLHDVGKIGIPDNILLKAGSLDEEERRIIQTHSQRGHDILASVPDQQISAIAMIALHHHEAIDGSGYPNSLKGEEIPFLARIVCIADSYDAIATVRPYHNPKRHSEVMQMLYDQQGQKYDSYVLAAFSKIVELSPHRALN